MIGSVSRCQPSAHCAARSTLARAAHGGHLLARVAPHGMSTCSVSRVSRLMRRSWTGCRQAPWASATARTASRVVGWASRSARVVRPVMGSLRPASLRGGGGACSSVMMAAACSGVRPCRCRCWLPGSRRQTAVGGQELGLQFGDRLPQRHRVGEHGTGRVTGHIRPAAGSCVQPGVLLLVAAAGEHHIANQPDHQHAAADCQDDQQECQHAGQDVGGQDDAEGEHDELAQAGRAVAVGVGAVHHCPPPAEVRSAASWR